MNCCRQGFPAPLSFQLSAHPVVQLIIFKLNHLTSVQFQAGCQPTHLPLPASIALSRKWRLSVASHWLLALQTRWHVVGPGTEKLFIRRICSINLKKKKETGTTVSLDRIKQKGNKPYQLLPNLIWQFNFLQKTAVQIFVWISVNFLHYTKQIP